MIHLYADDTVIFSSSSDISQIQYSIQTDFNLVQKRLSANKLLLNMNKILYCFARDKILCL